MMERTSVVYEVTPTAVALAKKLARVAFALRTRGETTDGRPVAT